MFNYVFIAISILWQPLQLTILPFDGKGRTIMLLTITSFFINIKKKTYKTLFTSKPIIFWFIWCIYVTINTYINGFTHEHTTFTMYVFNNIFCPFMIMVASAYEYIKNPDKFLKFALYVFITYTIIGAFVLDIGYVALQEGKENAKTLGNALALNTMLIIFFTAILYNKRDVTLRRSIIIILFALFIVTISATRKALGASVIMIIALILSNTKWTFKNFIKILFPLFILYIGLNYIMSNTQMGERLNEIDETSEQLADQYDIEGNLFLEAMGDRAPHYILGTEAFLEHPLTGIGLHNFTKLTSKGVMLHTEYMVQICECGIIGTTLFILFYLSIVKGLLYTYRIRKDERAITISMMGTILALLFIYLTTWSYSFPFYFTVLGCIIAHIKNPKIIR